MKRRITLVVLVLFTVLASGCATMSPSGRYILGSGQTLTGDLVISSGEARLEEGSRVTGNVIMTSGDLYVEADAEIKGDLVMFSGDIFLRPGAIVRGNVIRSSGDIHQEEGARIEGQVSSNIAGFIIGYIARVIVLFCVLPIVFFGVLLGGALFFVSRRRGRPVAEVPVAEAEAPTLSEDPTQRLKQLKEMLDDGLISEADYEAKKTEILSRM